MDICFLKNYDDSMEITCGINDFIDYIGFPPKTIRLSGYDDVFNLNDVKTWEILRDNGLNIGESCDKHHFLQKAVFFYNIDVVKFLINNGADVNNHHSYWYDATPLYMCAIFGNLDMFKLLLSYGADYGDKDCLLIQSCHAGSVNIVKYLLDNGFNVNIGSFYDCNGSEDLLELVLHALHICQIDDEDDKSKCNDYENIIKLLLDYGINISEKSKQLISFCKLNKMIENRE